MSHRRLALLVVLALSLPVVALAAQGTEPKAPPKASAAPKAPSEDQWGLVFDASNLLALGGFNDGIQAGAGIKYWATQKIAVRGLLGVEHNTPKSSSLPSVTTIGLGLAGEWHPRRDDSSPYAGALVGARARAKTSQTLAMDLYFGGLFGAEVKILSSVYAFAEYDLTMRFDANGFSVNLGTDGSGGSKALIGLIVYF